MTKINFALNRKGAKRVSSKLKMRLTLKGPKQLNDEGLMRSKSRRIEPAMPIGPIPIAFFDQAYNEKRVELSIPDAIQKRRFGITDMDVRGWNGEMEYWRNKAATKLEEIKRQNLHRSWYSFDEMDEFEAWLKSELGGAVTKPDGAYSADIRIVARFAVDSLRKVKHWPSDARTQLKDAYINQYSHVVTVLNN